MSLASTTYLQKASWRIKHLVAHKRSKSLEDSDEAVSGEIAVTCHSANTSRRASWLSQPTAANPQLRQASGNPTLPISWPKPLENSTPRSSASSLCSYECGAKSSLVDISLSESQCTPTDPEILYLPPLQLSNITGDARTWRFIFSESSELQDPIESTFNSTIPAPATFLSEVTFDLLEALSLKPPDQDKTPTPSIRIPETLTMDNTLDVSSNVEMLIRETDEAFQAVGDALADAKAATADWNDTPNVQSLTLKTELSHATSKRQPNASSQPKSPIVKSNSVSKTKKTDISKKRTRQQSKAASKNLSKTQQGLMRWAGVTNNMVDALSGRLFRTEVDEMLSPGRLRQLRDEIRAKRAAKEPQESVNLEETTPTSPFHPWSLSSHIGDAVPFDADSYWDKVLPLVNTSPPAIPPKSVARAARLQQTVSTTDTCMVYGNLNSLALARQSIGHHPYRSTKTLSVIEEVFPLTPTISRFSPIAQNFPSPSREASSSRFSPTTQTRRPSLSQGVTSTHIVLPSTPFTLTAPLFRHGHIRIEYPTIADESLDWTAFQMAISGTMDEENDPLERERRREEAELDDLVGWWEGFGMGLGEMKSMKPRVQRIRVYAKDKHNREVPWTGEKMEGGVWGVKMEEPQSLMSPISPKSLTSPMSPKSLTSPMSPMSPMGDLAATGADRRSVVPMGYNLNYDLGDFLEWEVRHVQNLCIDDGD